MILEELKGKSGMKVRQKYDKSRTKVGQIGSLLGVLLTGREVFL